MPPDVVLFLPWHTEKNSGDVFRVKNITFTFHIIFSRVLLSLSLVTILSPPKNFILYGRRFYKGDKTHAGFSLAEKAVGGQVTRHDKDKKEKMK